MCNSYILAPQTEPELNDYQRLTNFFKEQVGFQDYEDDDSISFNDNSSGHDDMQACPQTQPIIVNKLDSSVSMPHLRTTSNNTPLSGLESRVQSQSTMSSVVGYVDPSTLEATSHTSSVNLPYTHSPDDYQFPIAVSHAEDYIIPGETSILSAPQVCATPELDRLHVYEYIFILNTCNCYNAAYSTDITNQLFNYVNLHDA